MLFDEVDPRDIDSMNEMIDKMTGPQLEETLEALAKREALLLIHERIVADPDMKEITKWNVAALCAAINRISQARTPLSSTGTSPDEPGSRATPGSKSRPSSSRRGAKSGPRKGS